MGGYTYRYKHIKKPSSFTPGTEYSPHLFREGLEEGLLSARVLSNEEEEEEEERTNEFGRRSTF